MMFQENVTNVELLISNHILWLFLVYNQSRMKIVSSYNGKKLRTENNKHVLFLSNKILVFFCGSGRFTLTSKCPQPGLESRASCEISYLW